MDCKHLISGKELPENTADYIFEKADTAVINITFDVESEEFVYQVFYEVSIKRADEGRVRVYNESINYKECMDGK